MFEFYRENVKYYLQIALYRYMVYFAIAIPLMIPLIMVVLLLWKINLSLFNIAVVSIAVAPLIIGVFLLLALAGKFVFITGYSFLKGQEESAKRGHILFRIARRVTSPKLLLLALFLLIPGYILYTRVLPQVFPQADLNIIILRLGVALLIYVVLAFLFLSRHLVINLVRALWEYFPGPAWKLLMTLALIIGQLALLAIIYLVVSMVLIT